MPHQTLSPPHPVVTGARHPDRPGTGEGGEDPQSTPPTAVKYAGVPTKKGGIEPMHPTNTGLNDSPGIHQHECVSYMPSCPP